MAAYTFISSRDPVGGDRIAHTVAVDLARAGNEVALFLVENGTFLARAGVCSDLRADLLDAGVTLFADDLSLTERGIVGSAVAPGVQATSIAAVVDHLAAGRKVAWH